MPDPQLTGGCHRVGFPDPKTCPIIAAPPRTRPCGGKSLPSTNPSGNSPTNTSTRSPGLSHPAGDSPGHSSTDSSGCSTSNSPGHSPSDSSHRPPSLSHSASDSSSHPTGRFITTGCGGTTKSSGRCPTNTCRCLPPFSAHNKEFCPACGRFPHSGGRIAQTCGSGSSHRNFLGSKTQSRRCCSGAQFRWGS